jgi:hypothetical protein
VEAKRGKGRETAKRRGSAWAGVWKSVSTIASLLVGQWCERCGPDVERSVWGLWTVFGTCDGDGVCLAPAAAVDVGVFVREGEVAFVVQVGI